MILALTVHALPNEGFADEAGVSFWIPGLFGSLAATPQTPGFSAAFIYYHTSVRAGGDVAFARQVNRGNITANFSGNLNANLDADADIGFFVPSYVFAERFLGGQAAISMLVPYGRSKASVDATLTGAGPAGFTLSGSRTDTVTGFADLAPQFSVRWNAGVHNFMTYLTGNLTTGRYDPARLANLGLGHNAIDGGGAYTYFNPQTGHEFSTTLGFTYNFENEHTQYQNGVDMHLDVGASKFVTKQFQVGLVGYWYNQLSCDSGAGDRVGCFESRVAGIGPQIGYIIPLGTDYQGYINLKGYKEFAAKHRPDGWNVWLTFAISPAAKHEVVSKATITK
ncbi:MAG TPA: transporter [Pseudolabrys sp.]|nr:transporter [Pseudolabrys sp.]